MKNTIKIILTVALVGLTVGGIAYAQFIPGSFWKLNSGLVSPMTSTWTIHSTDDLRFDDEILPDGDLCGNSELLFKTGADDWDCKTFANAGGSAYLPLAGGTMVGALTLSGAPTVNLHAATKEYVDLAVGFQFDYFFNNTSAGIGATGYFNMTDTDLGGAETTDLETTITNGVDDQELVEFISLSGQPGVEELSAGVYTFHFHAERTSGNSTVDAIYVELWKYEVSTVETLLGTSELTSEIVESKESYEIHTSIGSEITIASTDRLLVKFYANTGSGGGSGSDVEIYAEGDTSSRFSFETTSAILSTLFVRKEGDTMTGKLIISQGSNDYGLNIAVADARADGWPAIYLEDASSDEKVELMDSRTAGEGSNWFWRNLASAATAGPLMFLEQDNAGDDQPALKIQQDGSGLAIDASGSISGTTLLATAASSLTLGTASAADGAIIFQNATNANTLTIQSGATSGTYTLTLPLAVAGAGEVLTDAAGNGVLSWSAAGAGDIIDVGDCATGAAFTGACGTALSSNTDLIMHIDEDNDGTESFEVKDGANATILYLTEAGVLQIDNNLTIGAGAAANYTITFDSDGVDGVISWDRAADNFTFTDILLPALSVDAGTYAADSIDFADIVDADQATTKCIAIETPADADDLMFFRNNRAATVTSVDCIVEAATSAIVVIVECDSAGDNCGTSRFTESLTCDVDGDTDDGVAETGIVAGAWLRAQVGTVTGTVGHVTACITFTYDD